MFRDKKNVVIFVLSVIILMIVIGFATFLILNSIKNNKNVDGSKMSSSELLEMFEKEGYKIELTEFSGQSGTYIILEDNKNGITIQKILNTLLGTMMTFEDNTINDKMADLIDLSENNTKEKEQQYEAYERWLKKYNITKTQLSQMLDSYYNNNKDKIEVINTDELLKSFK